MFVKTACLLLVCLSCLFGKTIAKWPDCDGVVKVTVYLNSFVIRNVCVIEHANGLTYLWGKDGKFLGMYPKDTAIVPVVEEGA